jgi:hypothetical protein
MRALPFSDSGSQAPLCTPASDLTDQRQAISRAVKALLSVLSVLGVPVQCRALIDALVALSDGRPSFEADDYAIAREVFKGESDPKARERLKKKVQRWRRALVIWQKKTGFTLIQIAPGYKTGEGPDEVKHKTVYRLPLLELAAQVLQRPGVNMRDAACGVLAELKRRPPVIERASNRPRPDADTYRKAALTFARKMCESVGPERARAYAEDLAGEMRRIAEQIAGDADSCTPETETPAQAPDPRAVAAFDAICERLRRDAPADSTDIKEGTQGAQSTAPACVPPVTVESTQTGTDASHPMPASRDASVPPLTPEAEALQALEAFESVGVASFEVTMRDEATGAPALFEVVDGTALRSRLAHYMQRNATAGESFIVRPRGAALIQIDDLDAAALVRVLPFSLLAVETSPANYQAWIALAAVDAAAVADVRARLIRGVSADKGASGALRWPGSLNLKPARRLPSGEAPRVRVAAVAFANCATVAGMEACCVLASPSNPTPTPQQPRALRAVQALPSYDVELQRKPSRSEADAAFLAIARDRGFTRAEAIAALESVPESKAHEERERGHGDYIRRTADMVFGS